MRKFLSAIVVSAVLSVCSILIAGGIEISEFMAVNSSVIADSFGNYSDWIELHNTTGSTIDLENYYLTDNADDLAKWQLPSVSMEADGYLLIFASGKDLTDPTGELHTSFKLSGDGEYLALVMPDASTVVCEYSPNFPVQSENISYGLLDSIEYYFSAPTPGGANYRSSAGTVSFSAESGTFTDSFQLTLTAESPNAVIRYTTNGSTPTTSSSIYTSSLTISQSTRVLAMATETSLENGPVCDGCYIQLGTDVQNFSSNMPLVILETWGSTIKDSTDITATAVFMQDSGSDRTYLSSDIDFAGRIAIHSRGNTSATFPKKQYKVELQDTEGDEADFDLYDLGNGSDWVLYAPYSDKTYMRNQLSYSWAKQMGDEAVDCQYCEVFLNSDGDGSVAYEDYVGIYLLCEKIKIDKNRCETETMPDSPGDVNTFNGGFLIEKEGESRNLVSGGYFTTSNVGSSCYWTYADPDVDEITTDQKTYVKGKIERFEDILWNSSTLSYYDQYCIEQAFVDYELIQQLSKNKDGWFSSVHVWLNPDDMLVIGPVWDFNIGYGNFNNNYVYTSDWLDIRTAAWWAKLFLDSEFEQAWIDRWGELRSGILSDDAIDSAIDERIDYLAEAEARDHAKWPTLGVSVWPNPTGATSRTTWDDELDYFRNWIHDRANWMDSQVVDQPELSRASGVVATGTTITINTTANDVYYTTDGTDPRATGGSVASGAAAYSPGGYVTETLIAEDSYWHYNDSGDNLYTAWNTLTYDDSAWSGGYAELGYGDGDETTQVSYGSSSSNKNITTYFRGYFNIEDVNSVSSLTLNLLRDDGAVVYINGVEVVRSNMDSGDITYITQAQSNAAETTWYAFSDLDTSMLVDGENVIAVEVHQISSTSSDISFNLSLSALLPSGDDSDTIVINSNTHIIARSYTSGQWSAPAEAYYITDGAYPVVTEINYNPYDLTDSEIAAGFDEEQDMEFIEFYNPTTQELSLDGITIIDGVNCELDADAVLESGCYGVVVPNISAFQQRYGSGITILGTYSGSLDNSGETLIVSDPLGTQFTVINYNDTGSWPGRADGKGSSLELEELSYDVTLPSSWSSSVIYGGTPGAANGGSIGDIVINEVLTHTDLPDVDFIELHNTTSAAIDISGWWISDSSSLFEKFVVSDGTSIPAYGYLVFDEYDFNVSGLDEDKTNDIETDFGLNSYLGDEVWLIEVSSDEAIRFVDHIEFDAAANGVSFGRWPNGSGRLYPMASVTSGAVNSGPAVGPLCITELMYMPINGDDYEFIELCNITGSDLSLDGWMIDKGVTFEFPTGYELAAGSYVVIAPFDPSDSANADLLSAFYSLYGIDTSVDIIGGYIGVFSDNGERIRIVYPDDPPAEAPSVIPYITVEDIDYLAVSPWPEAAANSLSIHRLDSSTWSDDPANWLAATPSPGNGSAVLNGDANTDGTVNIYDFLILKSNYGTTSGATWAMGDFTGDGAVNISDFLVLKANYGTSSN